MKEDKIPRRNVTNLVAGADPTIQGFSSEIRIEIKEEKRHVL